ncbi:MAG: ATP-binding protein [Chloroflexi bacterium]|nr:ATP-binding protein [Chloroflexota bacterium]
MSPVTMTPTVTPIQDNLSHLLAALAVVDVRVKWAVARARANGLNPQDEFRGLYISDEQVEQMLGYNIGQHLWSSANGHGPNGHEWHWPDLILQAQQQWQAHTQAAREMGVFMRLDHLIHAFALTPEETDAFLLTLAPEIDPRYTHIYAYLQDDVTRKRPSVDLLLNLLTENFSQKLQQRWLFGRNGRLLQTRLLQLSGSDKELLAQTVRPSPHILEYLLGDNQLDEKLCANCARLIVADETLPRRLTPQFLAQLTQANNTAEELPPLFAFSGIYGTGKQEAARHLAATQHQPLLIVNCAALGEKEEAIGSLIQRVLRDGRLYHATLYLTHWQTILQDGRPPQNIFRAMMAYPHTIIVAGDTAWQPANHLHRRPVFAVNFTVPDYDGRLHIWRSHLPEAGLDLTAVANHFRFTPGQIEDAIATARDLAQWRSEPLSEADLFAASRTHSNQNLSTLAAKIKPRYTWDDIILPSDTFNQLREMVNTVHRRPTVYGEWGFDRKLALGKGLSSLFAGESGTGKTMSADIMAGELGLDLYKVDLSTVVSKYIGETEKNLDRIFTEAATSNAILFFDEADAIFGKRSEVKDSHDRYANIEISYLLQRMEAYDGVVILATNMRANLDDAFTRRLHFAIEFPFPEAEDREHIWRVNFPPETPTAADVDFKLLAQRYPVAGGNIRNIILAAAFLAAETHEPVGMRHLMHAARREYQKIGRLIDDRLFEMPKRD